MSVKGKFGFDLTQHWDWKALESHLNQPQTVEELKTHLTLEDARFLLGQLTTLSDPKEIEKLVEYQVLQEQWGGSFHGN